MESSSRSVTLDMADTTITVDRRECSAILSSAARRMRSAEPMLVPPNFITKSPAGTGGDVLWAIVRSLRSMSLPVGSAISHHLEDGFLHLLRCHAAGIQILRIGSL